MNKLPTSTAKEVVFPVGLEVQKIHACANDCILHHGEENEKLKFCSVCKASRYMIRHDNPGDVEGDPREKILPSKLK
jgi:hypothetical protein